MSRWGLNPGGAGLLLLPVFWGCAGPATAPDFRLQREEWRPAAGVSGVRLRTDHYDIRVTSADDLLCDYLPAFMETCHAAYRRAMPCERDGGPPLDIYVFRDRPQWAAFTRAFVPAQAHVYLHIQSGGYMDAPSATAVLWDIGRDKTLSLMAHEGWHQYVARNCPAPLPPWLDEGMATQWEAFDLDGDVPVFTPRRNLLRRNSLREALILENGLIPLPELLRMNAGEAVMRTGQTVRGYYAQVWSMVLMLREERPYRDAFARLLADAGAGRTAAVVSAWKAASPEAAGMSPGEILFGRYITGDLEGFAAEYRDFARSLVH